MLGRPDGPLATGSCVPSFSFPEPAAAVLGRMGAYSRWLRTEAEGTFVPVAGVQLAAARHVLDAAILRGEPQLGPSDVGAVLGAYGLELPASVATTDADESEIVAVARTLGHPVALKAGRRRVGRSAEAGVALDLFDDDAVTDALRVMRASLGEERAR